MQGTVCKSKQDFSESLFFENEINKDTKTWLDEYIEENPQTAIEIVKDWREILWGAFKYIKDHDKPDIDYNNFIGNKYDYIFSGAFGELINSTSKSFMGSESADIIEKMLNHERNSSIMTQKKME